VKTPSVLVIDDEPDLLALIELTLTKLGLHVVAVLTVAEAKGLIGKQHFDLCMTDMRLKDGTGLDVLDTIAASGVDLPTVVITAHGNAENAVAALKRGAFDYLAKPVSIDQVRALVKSALALPTRAASVTPAPNASASLGTTKSSNEPRAIAGGRALLGESAPMVKLRELLDRLAQTQAPVHVQGESGTGKETAARILHEAGPRQSGPFVAVNCGAIPESLMEAEFFGAKKGAYTGANEDRLGFFQAANGGTLFLDEVADLPLSMQVKLLRAIQERAVRRVGGTAEEPVDVRLVSATHKKLDDLVAQGHFRQDLFYRLSVIPVHMPALREIRPDVPMIATALLHKLARGSAPHALTAAAQAALARYDFPGNVRELENLLERALALAGKPGVVDAADLFLAPIDVADHEPDAIATNDVSDIQAQVVDESSEQPVTRGNLPLQDFLDSVERTALAQALAQAKGNRTRAAQALGITFRSIRYRLERLGMERPD
jgi:two-component system, NtrC family, response regulator PilR